MANMSDARKAANKKWNSQNLIQISFGLPKELVQEFREKCKAEGISQASIVKDAIEKFLGK